MQKWNLITSLGFLSAIVLIVTIIVIFFVTDPISFLKKDTSGKISSSCSQNIARKFAPQQIGEFTKTQTIPTRQTDGITTHQALYSNSENQKLLILFSTDGETHHKIISPLLSGGKEWEEFVEKTAKYLERQDSSAGEKFQMERTKISGFPTAIALYKDPEFARSQERLPLLIQIAINKDMSITLSTDGINLDPILFTQDYLKIICN